MMEKNINIGQLKEKIQIVTVVKQPNAINELVEQEQTVSNCYAMLKDLTGSEAIDGKVIALDVKVFIIHYRSAIEKSAVKLFVRYLGLDYNINGVSRIGHKKYLALKCSHRE